MPMIIINGFVFSRERDSAYHELQRQLKPGFKPQARLANFPLQQLNNYASEKITLNQTWYMPAVNQNVGNLRKAIYKGGPLLITDGNGKKLGNFILSNYQETHSEILNNGNPQSIKVTLSLERYYD